MSGVPWKLSPLRAKRAELPLIIEAARFGDAVAYDELISRCFQPVLRYCSAMGSPADAHDLAQETFLRALKSKSVVTDVTNLEAFMIHVARYVCADYVREIVKVRQLHSQLEQKTLTHNTDEIETGDFEYEAMLSPLPDAMREAFVLTQLLGFSYQEVSDISKIPIGTVRSRVARARQLLQDSSKTYAQ